MYKNLKAVIFDFDDTLVDTEAFFLRHLIKTLTETYGPDYDKNLIESAKEAWAKNLGFEDIFQATFGQEWEKILENYRADALETKYTPRAEMLEYVTQLKNEGVKLYILSNRTRMLDVRLIQAGFDPNDFQIYEAVNKKPNPLAYSEVLKDIEDQNIEKEEVLIYGNHIDDYNALPDEWKHSFRALPKSQDMFDEFRKLYEEEKVEKENILFPELREIN